MSYEETLTHEDFLSEWQSDSLNIPVRAYWDKEEQAFNVEFAHPRKLTMSSITVTGMSKSDALAWVGVNQPAPIKVVIL